MTYRGIYVVRAEITNPGAVTLLQIKAGATNPLEIIRASISQTGTTTSAQMCAQIVRKSGAATVTSFTPLLLRTNDVAAAAVGGTSATGYNASGEGTDTDILLSEGWNVLNGWLYLPVPEERIYVPAAGIIGLKMLIAGGNYLYKATMVFGELG
jgi:hypothetical protein